MTEDKVPFFVGSHIAAIRRGREMTQAELAAEARLNTSYLGLIERGEVNPSIKTLYRIAEALDISMTSLININPVPSKDDDIEDAKLIIRLLRCVRPEVMKLVLAELEAKK